MLQSFGCSAAKYMPAILYGEDASAHGKWTLRQHSMLHASASWGREWAVAPSSAQISGLTAAHRNRESATAEGWRACMHACHTARLAGTSPPAQGCPSSGTGASPRARLASGHSPAPSPTAASPAATWARAVLRPLPMCSVNVGKPPAQRTMASNLKPAPQCRQTTQSVSQGAVQLQDVVKNQPAHEHWRRLLQAGQGGAESTGPEKCTQVMTR